MKRNGNKQTGAALLCAALLLVLPLVACGGHDDSETAKIQVVNVSVSDNQLEMPASLPTGATTFQVTNTGSHDHSFGITGPSGDKRLEKALKPGETASMDMILDAGTYRVFCPVDEQAGHSMQMALNVHPDVDGSTGG
jgi:hypothetical protein